MMISTKFNVIAREMGVRAKSARTEVSFFRLLPRGTYLEKFATALHLLGQLAGQHARLDMAQKRAERDPEAAICSHRSRCASFCALIEIAVAMAASAMRFSDRI